MKSWPSRLFVDGFFNPKLIYYGDFGQECPADAISPDFLLISDYEIHCAVPIGGHCDRVLPGFWFGEDGALHGVLGENVVGLLFASQPPAFMPGNNLIGAGRNVPEFEASALVGDRVIRIRHNHHLGIHPDVATVATKIHQAGSGHVARSDLVGERKRQIETGCAVHMDGMKSGVRALHLQIGIFRDKKNVRDVAAMLLVEMTPLLGKFHRLSGGDVLEIDNGIGDAALGPDDQAFQADSFFATRIADLRIFRNGKIKLARLWPGPLYAARDGATVADGDNSVAILRGDISCC